MTDIVGQLTFGGREVSALKLDLPGMGTVDYELPEGEEPTLLTGDRVRVTVEYVIHGVDGREKHNADGVGVDSLKQIARARAIVPQCVSVDQVLRRAEIEAAWQQEHTG